VEINEDATKRTYKARTDEEWKGFKAQVLARFNVMNSIVYSHQGRSQGLTKQGE
jgi:hypothetical protein